MAENYFVFCDNRGDILSKIHKFIIQN